ncbi:MAG: phosphoribosylanthranilate isomerase [Thermoanaerobaculia bacterium]
MRAKPLVKICGITRPEDAELAVSLGADLLGLNFYPPSPRCLSLEAARAIVEAVRGQVGLVGVFVDRPPAEVAALDSALGFDFLQVHGREPASELEPHGARAIKVFRLRPGEPLPSLEPYPRAWGFLFDLWHPELYGGMGTGWDYRLLAPLAGSGRPYLVAGGIRPENARPALEESGAAGVDVCSGVESSPGRKDPDLLARLFHQLETPREPIDHGIRPT